MADGKNFSKFAQDFMARTRKGDVYAENDFSQFDAMQCETTIELALALYRACGMPEDICNMYKNKRMTWSLATQERDISMQGVEKKHSGAPDTLLENTFLNICINFYVLNFSELAISMHEGDDFVASAASISINKQNLSELSGVLHLKQKFSMVEVPRFCGKILTDSVWAPDLIYCVAKVNSKWYKDKANFREYQLAVQDWLKPITDWKSLDAVCNSQARYYRDFQITPTEVRIMYDYLGVFFKF
nr:MAG: nonstructural protein [Riboviria sp.]